MTDEDAKQAQQRAAIAAMLTDPHGSILCRPRKADQETVASALVVGPDGRLSQVRVH